MTVPYAIKGTTSVPVERYYDREFAALEETRLWARTWQMACRLEEIPSAGDFVEYRIGDQSVFVVRVDDSTIRAYQNACRHRGTELAKGSGTFAGGQIACPFHGWRWNLDGTNSFVYGAEGFPADVTGSPTLCLPSVRLDTWGACAWINLDPSAPPLLSALGPMPSLLDPLGIDRMRVQWWKAVHLKANWKLAMEAFIEGYHIMASHPQLTQGKSEAYDPNALAYSVHEGGHSHYISVPGAQRKHRQDINYLDEVDALIDSSRLLCEGLEAMTLPRDLAVIETLRDRRPPEGGSLGGELVQAIYAHAAAVGIDLPVLGGRDLVKWGGVFYVFPHYFVLPQYGNALTYRFRPVHGEPEECLLELWSISIPAAGEDYGKPVMQGPFAPEDRAHWPLIPSQDFSNITRQQAGLHNRSFHATHISHIYEVGIANMHQEVDRYLARG